MNWKVPYVDLGRQFKPLQKEYVREFKKVMSRGDFILRNDVKKFEKKIAKFLGVKYVVGVNSCTDALILSLGSIGLKRNSEVISVANTYVATLAAISHVGAKPILADVSNDHNIDADKIENLITKKTKAIVPVHLNGRPCDMDRIMKIARKYNLIVIEDAAQSFGAKYKNKLVGTFGTAGCFSLHPMKSLGGAGDGGFVATNNKKLYEKIFRFRNHGQGKRKNGRFEVLRYDIEHFGFCTRLDNLQAAIVNTKLRLFKYYIQKRRKIASTYSGALKNLPLVLPSSYENNKFFNVYNSYVIRTLKQKELFKFMRNNKIEVNINWPKPLYRYKCLELRNKILPNTERICKEMISLPIFPEMSSKEVNFVVNSIKKFFRS